LNLVFNGIKTKIIFPVGNSSAYKKVSNGEGYNVVNKNGLSK
jgi:hypothetical protein